MEETPMSKYIPVEPEKWAEMVKAMAENRLLKVELEETKDALFKHSTENHRLQVERQRLTKAGDAMEIALQADFNGCPYEPLVIMQAIRRWRTAKEGKPTAE
jgi:hypothetical protein